MREGQSSFRILISITDAQASKDRLASSDSRISTRASGYMVIGYMVFSGYMVNFFPVPRWTIYPGASVPRILMSSQLTFLN